MRKSTSTEASVILHWFSRPWVIEELLLVCCHGTDRSERSGRMEGRKQKMDNMQKNRLKTILTALPFPLLSPACRHLKGEMSPASFFLKLYSFFAFFLLCLYPHHLNTHTSLIKVDIKWKFFYFFFLKMLQILLWMTQPCVWHNIEKICRNFKEIILYCHKQSYFST